MFKQSLNYKLRLDNFIIIIITMEDNKKKSSSFRLTPQHINALKQLISNQQTLDWQQIANTMNNNFNLCLLPQDYIRIWKNHQKGTVKVEKAEWNEEEIKHVIKLFQKFGPEYKLISDTMEGKLYSDVQMLIKSLLHRAIRSLQFLAEGEFHEKIKTVTSKQLSKIISIMASKSNINSIEIRQLRNRLIDLVKTEDDKQKPSQSEIIQLYDDLKEFRKGRGFMCYEAEHFLDRNYIWNFHEQAKLCQFFFIKNRDMSVIMGCMINEFGFSQKFKDNILRCKINNLFKSAIQILAMISQEKYNKLYEKTKLENLDSVTKKIVNELDFNQKNKNSMKKLLNLNFDQVVEKEEVKSLIGFLKQYEGGRRIRNVSQTQHIRRNRKKQENDEDYE